MTAPLPPTSGPVSSQERLAAEDHGTPPDIQAPLPDLSAMTENAVSAGKAWCGGAAEWAESAQGAGGGGFNLTDEGATGEWDSDVSFPHQGP
jgi:hypothetical protein